MVGAGASLVGAGAAALVALTEFPGRRIFSVALVLPFAVPAYINAYVFADLLGPFGLIGRLAPPGTFEIRSLSGAAFILGLSVYPYVYLAVRASLAARSGSFMEAARTLGESPMGAVRRVLVPAGRPALAGGLALALMETVSDFGVADYFGVPTLSIGIFRTWYGLSDLVAASQLAGGLFLLALLLVMLEETVRRGSGADNTRAHRKTGRIKLSPFSAAFAVVFCFMPVLFGFLTPFGLLLAKLGAPEVSKVAYVLGKAAANTAFVASLGAVLALSLGTFLAYRARLPRVAIEKAAIRISTLGYALPGAVIAIGILAFQSTARDTIGLTLTGMLLLLYAYVTRFLTAGYNAVAGGAGQIHPLTDDAARALGAGPMTLAARVHLPILRPALGAGALIIFIDIAKELPATLLLRPFNFETLATQIYRLATDERLADAAPSALVLILVSLVPTLWIETIAKRGAR